MSAMKKFKFLSLFLILVLILSTAGCEKQPEAKERPMRVSEATPTAVPTPTLTATPEASPTPEPTATPTAEPTTAPTTVPTAAPTPVPTVGGFEAPERGCSIDFPTRELYHYDMDLTLDADAHTVGGHVVFRFYNDTEDTWNELCLRDYSSLFIDAETAGYPPSYKTNGAITKITNIVDGRDDSELKITSDQDVTVLWIPLDQPLVPNESMTLSYDFTAKIPTVADRYGLYNGIFNVTNFYPILAEYADGEWSHAPYYQMGECFYSEISDYDVRLTVPADFLVATTGTETGKQDNGETVTYTYNAPCVRDFVFSASDVFGIVDATYDGVHVNVLYNKKNPPANNMKASLNASLGAARDSLAAFGDAFGKYPYSELDIILAPIEAGGMEYPNLIIIEDSLCPSGLLEYSTSEDIYRDLEVCIAHEIGHQWFMGIVGSNSGMQPWQDESITSYTELVYDEYLGKINEYIREFGRKARDLSDPAVAATLTRTGLFPLNRPYYDFSADRVYVLAVYSYGQQALFQMEEIVGRDTFHSILREYVHRYAFTNAGAMSFFEVLFDCCGTDNAELNALVNAAFIMQ
jgi:Aminopeptidase N